MHAVARVTLFSLVLAVSACSMHRPAPTTGPTIAPAGPRTQPQAPDAPVIKPPKAVPRTSATFAPPPGGDSHWDAGLGVYVLDGQADTFYRQRTYYRWSSGWSRSISPDGPWEQTDIHGVPPGLSKHYGQ